METTIMGLSGWLSKNYGSFLDSYGTHYLGYPKRDHNFDNHPYRDYYKDPVISATVDPTSSSKDQTLGLTPRPETFAP